MPGCRLVSGHELKRMREAYERNHGRAEGWRRMSRELREQLSKKTLRPEDFSIRELAEALVPDGSEWLNSYVNPRASLESFMEASSEVNTNLFFNITGQLVFFDVQEKYEDEEFVFMKSIESKQSGIITGMEKIPGFRRIGDEALVVPEAAPYPPAGFGEDYIEIGPKQKRGFTVPLTREVIAADLTGKLMEVAGEHAYFLGLNTEKRVIDALIDENAGAATAVGGGHRYHWKGTSYATYQTTTPWDNTTGTNSLVDWSDIDNAWQTLAAIVDPYTGEPIMINPDTIIVASGLVWRAAQIVAATQVRNTTPGFATGSNPVQSDGPNPIPLVLGSNLKILSSRLLTARLGTDTDWFLGNPKKAVRRYYNWEIETSQAPAGSPEDFHRDIVTQFKVSVRDIVSVIQPRVMNKSTAA